MISGKRGFQNDARLKKGGQLQCLPRGNPLRKCVLKNGFACSGVGKIEGEGAKTRFKCGRLEASIMDRYTRPNTCPKREEPEDD